MKKLLIIGLLALLFVNIAYAQTNCSSLDTTIEIDIDDRPYVADQTDFLAILPSSYRTHSMKCWSYVKADNNLQQTNPQPLGYSQTFFSRSKKTETREYFTAQNGIVNAYFTQKNLVAYTEFVLGVRCVSENTGELIIGEKCITPYYKEMKTVTARSVWAVENMHMLIFLAFIVIIIIIFVGYYYRKIKRVL